MYPKLVSLKYVTYVTLRFIVSCITLIFYMFWETCPYISYLFFKITVKQCRGFNGTKVGLRNSSQIYWMRKITK